MFTLSEQHLDRLSALVFEASGIQVSDAKRSVVRTRLGRRLHEMGVNSFRHYLQLLSDDAQEKSYLFDLISTNYSYFFREEEHFRFLAEVSLPPLFAPGADDGTPVKIWSAAAAAGQEPYSIGIETLETRARLGSVRPVSIFGTDISTAALDKARAGVYPEEVISSIPAERRRRWFQQGTGKFAGTARVRKELRDVVTYSCMNIVANMPPDLFHIIFIRNMMIYFDRNTQEKLIAALTLHLLPEGWLVIGHSENLTSIKHTLVSHGQTLFRRKR